MLLLRAVTYVTHVLFLPSSARADHGGLLLVMNSTQLMHDKTIRTMVRSWAWRQRGRSFCDSCIATKLAMDRDTIACITMSSEGSGFVRVWGTCEGCGKQTMVSSMAKDVLVA